VLSVHRDDQKEEVLLDRDVDMDNWPAEAWSAEYRESTVEDDAAEAVMGEV
jgi:hypothetical protein